MHNKFGYRNMERKQRICYTEKQLKRNYQALPGKENGFEIIRIAWGNY